MKLDPELVLGATDYIMVAGYLERIGDYVTNICEVDHLFGYRENHRIEHKQQIRRLTDLWMQDEKR